MGTRLGLFEYQGDDVEAFEGWCTHFLDYNTSDHSYSAESIQVIAEGSSVNGPVRGSFAKTISLFKEGFGGPNAKGGELDSLYVTLRQDARDGVRADGCGILIDAAFYDNDGFVGGIEGATSKISKASQTVVTKMSYQIGCMDHSTSTEIAYYSKAMVGEISYGLRLDSAGPTNFFSYYLMFCYSNHPVFSVGWSGNMKMGNASNLSTMTVRVEPDGMMAWVNSNETARLAWLDQAGNLGVRSSLDLSPQVVAPAIKQGRIWFNGTTGDLMICRDGATWTAL